MNNSNWTGRTARTTEQALGCTGHAIYAYRTPLYKRLLFAFMRYGWAIIIAVLAVLVLSGCVDMQAEQDVAADLRDAVAQARSSNEKYIHGICTGEWILIEWRLDEQLRAMREETKVKSAEFAKSYQAPKSPQKE